MGYGHMLMGQSVSRGMALCLVLGICSELGLVSCLRGGTCFQGLPVCMELGFPSILKARAVPAGLVLLAFPSQPLCCLARAQESAPLRLPPLWWV